MERVERLLNLLGALIDTDRPLLRADIARRVPGYSAEPIAFRRAFERDKDALRSMGVPLVTELINPDHPEDGEGYRIPKEQYALPDPGLTRDEMDALALAASSVKLSDGAAASALRKLGGDTARTQLQTVELQDDELLAQLFGARSERRRITFSYRGKNRSLDPHRLSFRNGHWYLNGFDHDYQEARTYRLDRMVDVSIDTQPGSFATPVSLERPWLPAWQMGDEAPVRAVVLIDGDQADLALDQVGEAAMVQKGDDGGVVVALEVTNQDAFRSFVLGFLDHAEVLEPVSLRNDIVQHLEQMAAGA